MQMKRLFWNILALSALGVILIGGAVPFESAWAKPYTQAELRAVETSNEIKIREIRDQEISQLRIALGRRNAVNRQAELYFRLAEIYVEAYRTAFLLEGRVHDKKLASHKEDKFIDRASSMPFLKLAIKACRDILNLGISYPKMDQVYYFLAFSAAELGNHKDSLKYFDEMTRRYPNSPLVGEAYRELGDAAFRETNFKKAQNLYQQAIQKSPAEMQPRIYHKLAWALYRQKQSGQAVDAMREAVTGSAKSGEKYLSLREEALRDMAIFMTETGRVEEAISYFKGVSGDKSFYPKVLERLGKQYERNVEPEKATQVYESLLQTNPDSDAAYRVLVKLVDLDLRRGRFKDALLRLKDVKSYAGDDSDTQMAAQNLKAMVRRTATEHHEKYRKKSEKSALHIAESYYTAYLNVFLAKEDPRGEIPEIRMYLAEVKRDLGKAKEASELYRQVVGSKDKRYVKEAGALWTASLAEAIKKAAGAKGNEPSELEKEYVEAADRLQEALGDTPEAREAALRAAQVLAGYKETQKESIGRIQQIITHWPKTAQALTAGRLWIQIFADKLLAPAPGASAALLEASGDAAEDLSDVLVDLRKNEVLMGADRDLGGGRLKSLMAEQELRLKVFDIARNEKERNFLAAAKGYELLAAETKDKVFSEKAFENAAGGYQKAGDFAGIERVIAGWLKKYPGSSKAIESIRNIATAQLIQGRFDLSARLFERAGLPGGDAASLETATRLYEGIGETVKAQATFMAYLEKFPKAENYWTLALGLAQSYEHSNNDAEAGRVYQSCLNGALDFQAACGAKLADLFVRLGNQEQAQATYKKVASLGGKTRTSASSHYVAYARFRLAEFHEKSGRFAPLQLPDTRLKKGMNQRTEFLNSLSKAYQSAVEAGGPWAIAALERLASWVMHFAQELDAIVPPAGASAESIAKFRKGIEGVSAPLKKKAISTWAEGYAKAVALELLSPSLPVLGDHLADYKVSKPVRAQGVGGGWRMGGLAADGGTSRTQAFQKIRERLTKNALDPVAWVDYGNLLWGEGKPILSKLAYDRALGLSPQYAVALNNRAVVELSGDGLEHWDRAAEAMALLQAAAKKDDFFVAPKMNRAVVLNYYRIFARAKPLWEQVVIKEPSAEALAGLAVALQGSGESQAAESYFQKAIEKGWDDDTFVIRYHQAARLAASGKQGASECFSLVEKILGTELSGFERSSAERLKEVCAKWKD